jgi:hypothetical protein
MSTSTHLSSAHPRTSKRRHKHGASARAVSRQVDEVIHQMPLRRRRRIQKSLDEHVVGAMLDEAFKSAMQPELDRLGETYTSEQIDATGVFG